MANEENVDLCYRVLSSGAEFIAQRSVQSFFLRKVSWKTMEDGFKTKEEAEKYIQDYDCDWSGPYGNC